MFYYGFNFLKGIDFFSDTRQYHVVYNNIDGLTVSNPVLINGFTVGRVSEINLLPERRNEIAITIDVDKKIPVGDSTIAEIISNDLLGSKAVELKLKTNSGFFNDGDTLFGSVQSNQIAELQKKVIPVMDEFKELSLRLQIAADKVAQSLDTFETTANSATYMFNQTTPEIKKTLAAYRELSYKLSDDENGLPKVIANMSEFSESLKDTDLKATVDSANMALSNLNKALTSINEGQGSLGKLLNDDSVYVNLNSSLKSFDSLLNHMNYYPKHFFGPLGKKHKKVVKDLEKANE
nr:MlaD family protein [Marinigracilibium pacificum]